MDVYSTLPDVRGCQLWIHASRYALKTLAGQVCALKKLQPTVHQVAGLSNLAGDYGSSADAVQVQSADSGVNAVVPGRDADGNVLAQPFSHDKDDGMLQEGTVRGGSPCKSILEVLLSERLDTTRAVLQVSSALQKVLG